MHAARRRGLVRTFNIEVYLRSRLPHDMAALGIARRSDRLGVLVEAVARETSGLISQALNQRGRRRFLQQVVLPGLEVCLGILIGLAIAGPDRKMVKKDPVVRNV